MCLAGGMDGYISKPIRAVQAVRNDRRSCHASSQRPRHSLPCTSSRLDWSKAVETVQGDIGLLRDIVATFLDECPRMLDGIQQSLRSNQFRDLQRTAHTLKGSMRYFGAKVAFDRAYELECQARDGQMQTADETLRSLRFELDQIQPRLRGLLATTVDDSRIPLWNRRCTMRIDRIELFHVAMPFDLSLAHGLRRRRGHSCRLVQDGKRIGGGLGGKLSSGRTLL